MPWIGLGVAETDEAETLMLENEVGLLGDVLQKERIGVVVTRDCEVVLL
jgi:hypothetical protein